MKRLHRMLALVTLLFVSLGSDASADEKLHGKWAGNTYLNQGEVLVFEAGGRATLDGEAFEWSVPGKGRLVYTFEGESLEMEYGIRGDVLTMTLFGEEVAYKRSGPPPPPVEKPKPTPKPGEKPANPLGKRENPLAKPKAPADPFARRFEGDGLVLILSTAAEGAYQGTLTFGGESLPVACRRSSDSLSGTFGEGEGAFPFTAALAGDKLTFETAGNQFDLTGEALASSGTIPPPMTGVAMGATKAWKHPRDWFSMKLPKAWDVTHADDEVVYVNPGLKQGDNQNAIILLTFGELSRKEQNTEVHTLMDGMVPDFKQYFAKQEISVTKPDGPSKKVLVGDVPGAIQTWKGQVQGTKNVDIWIATIIKRDAYLTMFAIVLGDESQKFLPGVKQTFMSLKANPPELNPELMAALSGAKLVLNLSGSGGTFITTYEFSAGGNVHRTTLMGGITGNSDVSGESTLGGTWEVIGDELYMYFKDGQDGGQILLEGGRPTSVKMGSETAHFQ